ncbi:alpha/beta hydrolase [Deinococcus irradiatisoli]|uniref:Alpha/beta hydrolase n=1 Tax=Deinococcus irradiatisoli TaxID=2202254 RepID=A0A2Z3JKL4_9DEIO|nr:alpha/beta hydrolase [Deinococcus irradiatisoli]AWN22458.1 alpha/beta hydrolase [Deinococcus irradiatisoli]
MTPRSSFPLVARVLLGVGLGVAATLGTGWYYADELVRARPVKRPVPRTRVWSVSREGTETLLKLTRNAVTARAGVLTLDWDRADGGALLGPVIEGGSGWVTRPLLRGGVYLHPGLSVRPSSMGLGTPAGRGLVFDNLTLEGEHGPLPAWFVPGQPAAGQSGEATTDWVIIMHGYQGLRQDALRFLPTYHDLGLNSLVVTYRNAHGAGRTPQGVYRLSADEWEDLEVAVRYARAQGARRIVLMGLSMGGSITLAFMRRSPLSQHIDGVILDSPALEWRELIRHHAVRYRLPVFLAPIVAKLTTLKSGQDFDAVDHFQHAHVYDRHMLIFHGSADNTVPVRQLDRLAEARPDLIEYVRVEGGEHLRNWNMDPERYERHLRQYLHRMLGSAGSSPTTSSSKENPHA